MAEAYDYRNECLLQIKSDREALLVFPNRVYKRKVAAVMFRGPNCVDKALHAAAEDGLPLLNFDDVLRYIENRQETPGEWMKRLRRAGSTLIAVPGSLGPRRA